MSFNEAGGPLRQIRATPARRRERRGRRPLRRKRSNSWHASVEGESAGVAKLEYARDLGSRGRETVRVRVPPSAPELKRCRQKAVSSETITLRTQRM